jgi:hypothetical protein
MKTQVLRASALLCLLSALASMSAPADAQTARRILVEVPFEFVAGDRTLPAGAYVVRRVLRDSDRVLLIQSLDGRRAVSVLTNSTAARASGEATRLDFRQYDGRYFLAQVWTAGADAGRELVKPALERSRERKLSERQKAHGATRSAAQGAASSLSPRVVSVAGRLQ